MTRGGARKGAGRKPKPLAEKLAAGNPGRRPLKKVQFTTGGGSPVLTPDYLNLMVKKIEGIPTPAQIFEETVAYLEPSDCLDIIPVALIADYALAKYYLICAQYELSKTATVGYNDKRELVVTSFTEAMLKMQKNALATWTPIWDIVSRNSEKLLPNPEDELIAAILAGRVRRKKPKEDDSLGADGHTENSGGATEPGGL